VVTIPGISGREPKEISFKSLAYIIQSRMEEIIDAVMYEVDHSGVVDKLSAGIVLTGGGALLRHLPQLVKFKTGLDVRIGYPVEQLATESIDEVNQPMYSTSVGLLLKGYDNQVRKSQIDEDSGKEEPGAVDDEGKAKTGSGNIFKDIKTRISEIFEENDSEM
jgi:cell division protein FtsA